MRQAEILVWVYVLDNMRKTMRVITPKGTEEPENGITRG
jgi:hypothetical protein